MANRVKKTVCIVSTVPPEGGGVSTYTKNLFDAFDSSSFELVFLAQKSSRPYPRIGNAKIVGCWAIGLWYPFQIFKSLCRYKPSVVHVQHEYFIFGSAMSSAIFPLLSVFSRFLRTKFVITLHGVVNPVEIRDPELSSVGNESLKGIPKSVSQIGLLLITKLFLLNSDKVVLMNQTHSDVLVREYHCSKEKIVLIPHGIPRCVVIDKDSAKKQLGFSGKKVVLYFGYLTKYKGIDILIKAFNQIDNPNSVLIIGGSVHPRLKNELEYKKYFDSITKLISENSRIKLVGFIPDDVLSTYVSAADIVVFPYIASFSTGGPMNITLGHHKPVIASKVSSFSDVLPKMAVFKTGSVSDLARLLRQAISDGQFVEELAKSTEHIAEERSWKNIACLTSDLYKHLLTEQKS